MGALGPGETHDVLDACHVFCGEEVWFGMGDEWEPETKSLLGGAMRAEGRG